MKSMMRIVLGVVSVAMIMAVAAPVAEAQCGAGARNFATIGGSGLVNMRIDPAGTFGQLGSEFGRFWQCDDSASGNNFDPASGDAKTMAPAGTGLCASTDAAQAGGGWWQVAATTLRGVNGLISGTGCFASTCPAGDFCTVVEDWGTDGPPGVGDTAYFIGWRSNETPPDFRYWDHAKFCGASTCNVPFEQFPVPWIISSAKGATGDRDIVMESNVDPALNVYVQTPAAGPASQLIASYDLMIHTGTVDPGRDRNSGAWSLLASLPYEDAALGQTPIVVPCDNEIDDSFIAFGITFQGGPPGGPVPSQLVGRAIQIECDPNIADPNVRPKQQIRMDGRPDQRTPTRSGRTGR